MNIINQRTPTPRAWVLLLSAALVGAAFALTSGEAAAGSLGARPGVGTSAGFGGGAVGAGPGAPARGVGGGAVGAGPGVPARGAAGAPVAAPRGYVGVGGPANRGGPVNRAGRR